MIHFCHFFLGVYLTHPYLVVFSSTYLTHWIASSRCFPVVIATPNLQSLLCIDIVLSFMRNAHYYDVGWLLSIRYCYSFPLDRPPRVRTTTFHPCHCLIYLTVLVQYWTSLCTASLSTPIRPSLWDFCSSVQVFASGFLQIPPHDGHPCLWLIIPTVKAYSGLSPPSCRPCRAH